MTESDGSNSHNAQAQKGRITQWFWHFLIFILAVLAAWYYIDFSALISALSQPDSLSLLFMLIVATVDRFFMAGKWLHLLSLVTSTKVPYRVVLRATYESAFIARVTPIVLSSEVLRAYSVNQFVGQWQPVLSSMVIEKAVAVVSTSFLAMMGSYLIYEELLDKQLGLLPPALTLFALVVVLAIFLSMSSKFGTYVTRLVPHKKIGRLLTKLHNSYTLYSNYLGQLILNWFFAVLENSLQILLLYLSARAVGLDIAALQLVGILSISQLLRKFALIFEGWMLGEASVVITCAILGIDQSQALAFSLLAGATIIVSTIPGLITLILPSGRRKRQDVKQQIQSTDDDAKQFG